MEYSKKKIEYILVISASQTQGALELYKIEMIFEYEIQRKLVCF